VFAVPEAVYVSLQIEFAHQSAQRLDEFVAATGEQNFDQVRKMVSQLGTFQTLFGRKPP
jgi:hypothetical protein